MNRDRIGVYWHGELIGYIENLQIDNFEAYGKWIAESCPTTEKFVHAIEGGFEDVIVQIGNGTPSWLGNVEIVPDATIEIRTRPDLEG